MLGGAAEVVGEAAHAGRRPVMVSAAQARACAPPPEWPMTANRPMPKASATLATSAAADARSRPGWGVDPP